MCNRIVLGLFMIAFLSSTNLAFGGIEINGKAKREGNTVKVKVTATAVIGKKPFQARATADIAEFELKIGHEIEVREEAGGIEFRITASADEDEVEIDVRAKHKLGRASAKATIQIE